MKDIKTLPKWSIEFRTYCTRNGLTAEDVQKKTGISSTSISHYRTGKKRPSLKFCNKIKEGIGFDMYKALYESYQEEMECQNENTSKI